ncbi:hypothetical protein F2Q68_00017382 [Brassica cretica]|uniref:Uncharacterized protein n=1 Tax=Brassica cretica TaxID=69181 RepID=A0A8S9HJS9_BRACR|nr:hypothetical protein F2Q68_00017382 [Brassica cretica]
MTLSQRFPVADAHRMIRDECAGRVEVGSSDVSGSSSEVSSQASRPLRRVSREVPFDQIDCRPTIYHPGGIFEELCPLPPELLRDPRAQSLGNRQLPHGEKEEMGLAELEMLWRRELRDAMEKRELRDEMPWRRELRDEMSWIRDREIERERELGSRSRDRETRELQERELEMPGSRQRA